MRSTKFRSIVQDQLDRYPQLQVQDLYKLVYQAALGSEHAVGDAASARAWLGRELEVMGEGPPEPLIDPISPDGRIARVHLRPFLAGGGDPETLLSAVVKTASTWQATHDELRLLWASVVGMAIAGSIPFDATALQGFLAVQETDGLPPVHHSQAFRRLYRPAYRVVSLAHFEGWQAPSA